MTDSVSLVCAGFKAISAVVFFKYKQGSGRLDV